MFYNIKKKKKVCGGFVCLFVFWTVTSILLDILKYSSANNC